MSFVDPIYLFSTKVFVYSLIRRIALPTVLFLLIHANIDGSILVILL